MAGDPKELFRIKVTVGILALQGAVREHEKALRLAGAAAIPVRSPGELELVDGLVIPGGESTTIAKLMKMFGLYDPIQARADAGMPIFGTCAGLILLAQATVESGPELLGLADWTARRNAFGRQVDSFEIPLQIDAFGPPPLTGVFIRAPWVEDYGPGVQVLAVHMGHPVLVESGNHLGAAFHPELTDDLRIHRHFVSKVRLAKSPATV